MPDDRKTVWVCKVDSDHTVRLEDIPIEQFDALEKRLDTSWLNLIAAPLRTSEMTIAMYYKCCELVGVTPESGLTAVGLLDKFELVDDDRPTIYAGGLPDPSPPAQTTDG